jgi:hypothetical protein
VKNILEKYFYSRPLCLEVVGVVTGYGLDAQGLNPGRGKIFLFSKVSRHCGAHPASYPLNIGAYFPGGKAAGA